jgi:hypothetical protein
MRDRRLNPAARESFEPLRLDLRRRFARLCDGWSPVDFETLITRMARIQLRYDAVSGLPERFGAR